MNNNVKEVNLPEWMVSFYYDPMRQTVTIRDTFNGTMEQEIDASGKTVGGNVEWKSHIVAKAMIAFKTS